MNLGRVRLRRAIEVLYALQAQGNVPLSPEWFDAMAEHPGQAEMLEWEVNGARAHAASIARRSQFSGG